jgi:hypothetical protein
MSGVSLDQFAWNLREFDWTAPLKNDAARAQALRLMASYRQQAKDGGPNWQRVLTLALKFEGNYLYLLGVDSDPDQRFEDGWRWAGAYLWSNGIRGEAAKRVFCLDTLKKLVHPIGSKSETGADLTGKPYWSKIDLLLERWEAHQKKQSA